MDTELNLTLNNFSRYDDGTQFHAAKGNPLTKVQGKYGIRNPHDGSTDETFYTAGPKGFVILKKKISSDLLKQ